MPGAESSISSVLGGVRHVGERTDVRGERVVHRRAGHAWTANQEFDGRRRKHFVLGHLGVVRVEPGVFVIWVS